MNEIKRILGNRRILIALVLILIINGFLFAKEQAENEYGMNLTLPQTELSVSLDGGYVEQGEKANAKDTYAHYREWLGKVKEIPLSEAASVLEQEKDRMETLPKNENSLGDDTKAAYAAVNTLLSQTKYLNDYPDWLDSIQRNKDSMLSFSIFSDPDSFSGRNILKTADEFEKLQGVELTLGENGAVESLLTFSLTDYFLLIVLMIVSISFLEERKKGLWNVVHAAPGGRLRLAIKRTAILFCTSVFGVLLLYGTNFVIGFSIYGGYDNLSRSIQSVELLGGLPQLSTIGAFLSGWFLLRIGAAFFISLLLWLLLTAVHNVKYTILITGGILALEYSLYTFLPVQSSFNLFKYFNLFTYISMSDLYTNYLNIDLFGYPFGICRISQLALPALCVLLGTACIVINCCKKPAAGKDTLGRFAVKLNSITDRFLTRLRLFDFEAYKSMWIQKGIIVIALLVYLAPRLSYTAPVPVSNAAEGAARQYTAELAGEITEDTLNRIEHIQSELNQTIADYKSAQTAYENGEMEYPQFDVYAREAAVSQTKSEGLDIVRNRVEQLQEQAKEKGFTPYLIAETPFESVYGDTAENNRQSAAMLSLLILGLLLAGCMTYEKQSGITGLTASTVKGRGVLLTRKILLAAGCATLLWTVVYGLELRAFLMIVDTNTLSASVRNLSLFKHLPLGCSIGSVLLLLYGFRLLVLFSAAMFALLISSFMKQMGVSYIAVSGVLLLPSLLYAYMGLAPLRYLSLSVPLAVMSFLQMAQPLLVLGIAGIVLTTMIGISLYILRRNLSFRKWQ